MSKLVFVISPGRSGTEYLAELFGTASNSIAFHEPQPSMDKEIIQLVNECEYHTTFLQRRIKADAIEKILLENPGKIYCETSHVFIETYFDVVIDRFYDQVEIVVLRRDPIAILRSFLQLALHNNIFEKSRLIAPNAITSPIKFDFELLDIYDRYIAYLIDIEARAVNFFRDYWYLNMYEIRLSELNEEDKVRWLFSKLGLVFTEDTKNKLGTVINARPDQKVNEEISDDYCRLRFRQFYDKLIHSGVIIPNVYKTLFPILANRLAYQIKWAKGKILNIGSGDDGAGFGSAATHLDLDSWDLPNFVQGDCHNLPFEDRSFDTAILGDILEHCVDPDKAVMEAARVANRVVMTIPEANDLPSVGQHVELGIKRRADSYRNKVNSDKSDDDVIIAHKQQNPKLIKAVPESDMPHDGHINRFDEAWIKRMIDQTNMKILDFRKVPEAGWSNWLIVIERS